MSVVEESTWMKAAADKARHSRLSRAIVCMSCTGRPVHSFRVVSQSFHRGVDTPAMHPERQSSTRCRVGSHGHVGPDEVASRLKVELLAPYAGGNRSLYKVIGFMLSGQNPKQALVLKCLDSFFLIGKQTPRFTSAN